MSWWRAELNASDAVGSNPGTLHGNIVFASGKVGNAFRFDGISAHMRVADSPSLRFTSAMTVEFWVNPVAYPSFSGSLLGRWDALPGMDQRSYLVASDRTGIVFFHVTADGRDSVTSASTLNPVPLNQWTHFAGVYDGSALTVYVNGALASQTPYQGGIFAGTNDLGLGAAVGGLVPGDVLGPFNGLMDEVRLYNRALTASEIQGIFQAGGVGHYDAATGTLPAGYDRMSGQVLGTGDVGLSYVVIPGSSYALERTFNLVPANWVPLVTNTAGPDGLLVFTNSTASNMNSFFRIRSVP